MDERSFVSVPIERYAELLQDSMKLKLLEEAQAKNHYGVPPSVEEMILGKAGMNAESE